MKIPARPKFSACRDLISLYTILPAGELVVFAAFLTFVTFLFVLAAVQVVPHFRNGFMAHSLLALLVICAS